MEFLEKKQPLAIMLTLSTLCLGIASSAAPKPVSQAASYSPCSITPGKITELLLRPFEEYTTDDCTISTMKALPDLSEFKKLGPKTPFRIFDPEHAQLADKLINILLDPDNLDDFFVNAVAARQEINAQLFNYAYSYAILHRPDTNQTQVAPLVQVMPNKFIERKTLQQLKEYSASSGNIERCVRRDLTGTHENEEYNLAYFREDIGLNLHHWHWHLVFPYIRADIPPLKDRRGELFVYMHQQMNARYNFERLSNNMKRVQSFRNFSERIQEGYFSRLDSSPMTPYSDRPDDSVLKDFYSGENKTLVTVKSLSEFAERIRASIADGTIRYPNGTIEKPSDETYMDILGNLVESSTLSPNRKYYGDLHNLFHDGISVCHDPRKVHLTNPSVMGDTATTMRDPVFFKLHGFVDDLYEEHRVRLPPYNSQQLGFEGVRITNVKVMTKNVTANENEFLTYMKESGLDVSKSATINAKQSALVCFQHLQHIPFSYTINVKSTKTMLGSIRIFLAPSKDENGNSFDLNTQRRFFIELDRFVYPLKKGKNTILRESVDSSLTAPTNGTFQDLPLVPLPYIVDDDTKAYNGCGWPDYLLIPKGTREGLFSKLFVIVSDWETLDKVNGLNMTEGGINSGNVMCGVQGQKYPYKAPMGFPFDRTFKEKSLAELNSYTNMRVVDVKVKFTG